MVRRFFRGSVKLLALVLRFVAYAVARRRQWKTVRRARRDFRFGCELREQRLEDAGVYAWLLSDLHSLANVSFAHQPTHVGRRDIEEHLDLYTGIAIARRRYQSQLRRAEPAALGARFDEAMCKQRVLTASVIDRRRALSRRWAATTKMLDQQLLELEALIRLCCERAILGTGVT